jgi:hypothetical protein
MFLAIIRLPAETRTPQPVPLHPVPGCRFAALSTAAFERDEVPVSSVIHCRIAA